MQALLFRARAVTVELEGDTRLLVRHAKWRGLICTVAEQSGTMGATLEISGPIALFRNTRLYGWALGELVPLLAWCPRFRLRAGCDFEGRHLTLQLGTGDPIFPAAAPHQYDSQLEERFARDFRRRAPHWDVLREPEPITADGTLIFPDFALSTAPIRRAGGSWRSWASGRPTTWHASSSSIGERESPTWSSASMSAGTAPIPTCLREPLVVRFRRRLDPATVPRILG